MAQFLLTEITLDRDYGLVPVDNTDFSDLTNWTVDNAGINVQASNSLDITSVGGIGATSKILSPVITEVTNASGTDFTIQFDVASGFSFTYFAIIYSNGSPLFITPVVSGSAGTIEINFSGYTPFDQIEIWIQNTSALQNYVISNVSVFATDSSAFDDFDNGDKVSVYWDTVTNDLYLTRTDVPGLVVTPITNGPIIILSDPRNQCTNVFFPRDPTYDGDDPMDPLRSAYKCDYQVCSGNDLRVFKIKGAEVLEYPYVNKLIVYNSPVCVVNNIVCDVVFAANPVITPATNRFIYDGTVQLSASGSHGPVRYTESQPIGGITLWQDVDTAEPSSSSGLFEDLREGLHTFYAVDQYNCYARIDVLIPIATAIAYNPKYALQYNDKHTGVQTIIQILERAFNGITSDVVGGDNPFVISKPNGELNNKFDIPRSTSGIFNMISRRHFQYIGLYSQDDRKYLIAFTHGATSWKGFLIPSVYSEQYSANKNYEISVTAVDNLANLGQYDFLDESGNVIIGSLSLLEIICIILRKLDLPFNVVNAINKFSEGMDTDIDPLTQAFLECACFYEDDGTPLKCDIVLQAILKPLGAFIIQRDGKWWIIESDAQTAPYAWREFDLAMDIQGDGTHDPIIDVVTPQQVSPVLDGVLFAEGNHNLDIIPAYGKMSIIQTLRPRKSLFPTSLEKWSYTSVDGGVYYTPFDVEGSKDKGIEFFNMETGIARMASPFFEITSFNDSLKVSFDYKINLDRITNTVSVDPLWVRILWRLTVTVEGVEFNYHERIGWNRSAIITTSVSNVSIPSSHPTGVTFTVDTGLSLPVGAEIKVTADETHYIRGVVSDYDPDTGILLIQSRANVGTGSFSSWNFFVAGVDFRFNSLFVEDFGEDFLSFDKEIKLPSFSGAKNIEIQMELVFAGTYQQDFTSLAEFHAIPSFIYPLDYRVKGESPTYGDGFIVWYKLREGTDAESIDSIVRSSDYNGTSNAVVWEYEDISVNKFVVARSIEFIRPVTSIQVKEFRVAFLPTQKNAPEKFTTTFVNNANYKENLEVELLVGDLPPSIINDQLYTNIFRLADGTPTKNWKRSLFAEEATIQSILLKQYANQYTKPTWRISGSWIGPDIKLTSILKVITPAVTYTLVNPNDPGGSGWSQSGSGQSWDHSAGFSTVDFGVSETGNSFYISQPVSDLFAGQRVRVDFLLTRSGSSGGRIDRFVCVLFKSGQIVQSVLLADGLEFDETTERGVSFNVDQDADAIGFFIENITGNGGEAEYVIDSFNLSGVSSVRYYYANQMDRNDRGNLYNCELVQLIPAILSTDPEIDDTGGGNTGGSEDGSEGGNNGGSGFSGAYSDGFNGGFEISIT